MTGSITIPEVAHDTEEDEYVVCLLLLNVLNHWFLEGYADNAQFEIDIHSESSSKEPIKPLIRNKLLPKLRKKLAALGPALIAEHGKDIQHATGQQPTLATSKVTSSSHVNKSSTTSNNTTVTTNTAGHPSVNTTSLNVTDEFRTTAQELYTTFTTPDRLTAFTRAPPSVFEGAKPGGKFALFGGNVSGEFVSLDPPKKIVQKWRLGSWVEGHFSTLEIVFDQNDNDGVTVIRVEWQGVPVGEEEVVRRNWGEYYVRSIKTTFGYVLSFSSYARVCVTCPGLAGYFADIARSTASALSFERGPRAMFPHRDFQQPAEFLQVTGQRAQTGERHRNERGMHSKQTADARSIRERDSHRIDHSNPFRHNDR